MPLPELKGLLTDIATEELSHLEMIGAIVYQLTRNLSEDGLFALVITIDPKKKLIPLEPQVVSRGFIYMKDSEELTKNFIEDAKQFLENELKNSKVVNLTLIKQNLADHLSKIVYSKTDRKPIIIPIFMPVEI